MVLIFAEVLGSEFVAPALLFFFSEGRFGPGALFFHRVSDYGFQNGAKECFSAISFQREFLHAKFGFDRAENEPCKVCPLSAYRFPRYSCRR